MAPTTKRARRGVAIFVVLGAIFVVTMLGFIGLTLAGRDSQSSGALLDIKSRDQAAWAGLTLALARMEANPAGTVAALNAFIADPTAQNFVFTSTGFSLSTTPPSTPFAIGASATDQSAVRVQLLSINLNTPAANTVVGSNGIEVNLQSTGIGRNGDQHTVVGSYRILGLELSQTVVNANLAALTNALYISGNLSNSNIANNISGDVYISGDVSLNGTSAQTISGRLRVNGSFSSNATLSVTGNSWIGGNIYTNSGAPMHFSKNLGIGNGFSTMNANLTVDSNLNVYGSSSINWNSAVLRVGRQLYVRDQYFNIGGNIQVGGNAYFDNSLQVRGGGSDTIHGGLYVAGNTSANRFQGGDKVVLGPTLFAGSQSVTTDGPVFRAKRNLQSAGVWNQTNSGGLAVDSSARFSAGIGAISQWITVGNTAYLTASPQNNVNGPLTVGNAIYMKGTVDGSLSQNSGASQWRLSATGSKIWQYENTAALSGGTDPRVLNSSTNNAASRSLSVAAHPTLVTRPAGEPYGLTDPVIGMTGLDTATSLAANPPDTFKVDAVNSPVVNTASKTLSTAMCVAAGARTDNWHGNDFDTLWQYFNAQGWLLNGYMVLRIDSTSPLGSIGDTGTFHHKALFVIEKSINVNGRWPASADANAIQVVYVRGSGSLGQFGSQGDFYGLIFIENNPGSFQQAWGADSHLHGAMEFAQSGASYTGNSGKLSITLDQSVISNITSALPNALRPSNGGGGVAAQVIVNSTTLAFPAGGTPRIQFLRLGEFR